MKLRYIKPFDWLFIVLNLVMIYAHTVTNSSLGFALLHFVLIGFLLWMCSYFGKKMDKHEETMTQLTNQFEEILARTHGTRPSKPKLTIVKKEN